MYAAIAGLKTHMQNMNVIGNNIANVNTYGYKASRAVFKTTLYTTLSGGSNGTLIMGGTNPSQIGYGSNVANVDIDVSSGNYAVTGIATDLMLDGDGFFLVGTKDLVQNFDGSIDDATAFTSMTLTRVGDFQFRADGYLGKNDGNVVYGFLCTGILTEEMLIADKEVGKYAGMKAGDAIFSDQLVPIRYPRMAAAHYYVLDENGKKIPKHDDPDDPELVTGYEELILGKDPAETAPTWAAANNDVTTTSIKWEDIYDFETGKLKEGISAEGFDVVYPEERADFDGHLYDAAYSDALKGSVLQQAEFTGISVDPNTGIITATNYDTQEVITIGCIAIGHVTNPNGVTNIGNNYYKAGPGTGRLTIGISGGNAAAMGITQINRSLQVPDENGNYEIIDQLLAHSTNTKVISNGLEMSKTDLAQEISMMILTQRGYQANTRIITVTDSMLEELVNMKRG